MKKRSSSRTPTCHPQRKHKALGLCEDCYEADYRVRHPDRRKKAQRRWHKKNYAKNKVKLRRLALERYHHRFGNIDKDECRICSSKQDLALDHNHDTGLFRGVLCRKCNIGLGCFRDDFTLLLSAVTYLYETQTEP